MFLSVSRNSFSAFLSANWEMQLLPPILIKFCSNWYTIPFDVSHNTKLHCWCIHKVLVPSFAVTLDDFNKQVCIRDKQSVNLFPYNRICYLFLRNWLLCFWTSLTLLLRHLTLLLYWHFLVLHTNKKETKNKLMNFNSSFSNLSVQRKPSKCREWI